MKPPAGGAGGESVPKPPAGGGGGGWLVLSLVGLVGLAGVGGGGAYYADLILAEYLRMIEGAVGGLTGGKVEKKANDKKAVVPIRKEKAVSSKAKVDDKTPVTKATTNLVNTAGKK